MTSPRREPPIGHCMECDGWHRLDLGCPNSEGLSWWMVAILSMALMVIGVALWRRAVGS